MPAHDTRQVGPKTYTVRLVSEHVEPDRAFAAILYEAWDPVLQRQVALKEATALQQNERGRGFLTRARDEARLLAKIGEQRNLPLIYDVVEEQDRVWLVMEFVKGSTLSELYMQSGVHPPSHEGIAAILDIILDVCRALQTLHRHRVGHRDVAPDNIIVGKRGAKLVDVGLAVWSGRRAYEAWDEGEGTRGYRAPEQTAWRGPLTIPGPPSDVYSLGALLYRLLTASPLPPLPPGARPPLPSKKNTLVPPALDELVVCALSYEQKDRPPLGSFSARARAARDALLQIPKEASAVPPPAEIGPLEKSSPPDARAEAIETVTPEPDQVLGVEAHPLAKRYNEDMVKPPPIPSTPASPRPPRTPMPTLVEQEQARQQLLIVGGVIVACIGLASGCALVMVLFEIIRQALAG